MTKPICYLALLLIAMVIFPASHATSGGLADNPAWSGQLIRH